MEDQQPEVQEDDSKDSEHAGQDVFEAYGGPLMTCSGMCTENEWREEADCLTHLEREEGTILN